MWLYFVILINLQFQSIRLSTREVISWHYHQSFKGPIMLFLFLGIALWRALTVGRFVIHMGLNGAWKEKDSLRGTRVFLRTIHLYWPLAPFRKGYMVISLLFYQGICNELCFFFWDKIYELCFFPVSCVGIFPFECSCCYHFQSVMKVLTGSISMSIVKSPQ